MRTKTALAVVLGTATLSACAPVATSPASVAPSNSPSSASAGSSATAGQSAAGRDGNGTQAPEDRLTGVEWSRFVASCPLADQRKVVESVVKGDVTGDRLTDTLVVDTCSTSTSYNPSTVEVFDGASPADAPRTLGTLLSDVATSDRPWVRQVSVDGSAVVVSAVGLSPDATPACPDLKLTYRFAWDTNGFRRISRDGQRSKDCLPVG